MGPNLRYEFVLSTTKITASTYIAFSLVQYFAYYIYIGFEKQKIILFYDH